MRGILCFFFCLCTVLLFACASAPYRTSLQLNPEAGRLSLSPQDLDDAYNAAIATGVDLGYRVVSSSKEQRMVSLNRLRSTDLVSETNRGFRREQRLLSGRKHCLSESQATRGCDGQRVHRSVSREIES